MEPEYIQHHASILEKIMNLKQSHEGIFLKRGSALDGKPGVCTNHPTKAEVQFPFPDRRDLKSLSLGKEIKKIEFKNDQESIVLENLFIGKYAPPTITCYTEFFYSKGFSKQTDYYYRLVIPLEKEMKFHYSVEQVVFSTDLGYDSRTGTMVNFGNDQIFASVIHDKDSQFFLALESRQKQNYEHFCSKAFAVINGLCYATGHFAGSRGYFFAYTNRRMENFSHYYVNGLRDSSISSYIPVYTNPSGYQVISVSQARKFRSDKSLRMLSIKDLSSLCQRIMDNSDFASVIHLIHESSTASLLFMPAGFSVALESLSDIVLGKTKLELAPIHDKTLARNIRKSLLEKIHEHADSIGKDNVEVLTGRIEHINQITNIARLKAPFEMLDILLSDEDLKVLKTRNDLLHGRIPDLLKSGKERPDSRKNKDLYYTSMRFYTLLSMLILKWVGFDGYVMNHPKLQEPFTGIKLDETPYRK